MHPGSPAEHGDGHPRRVLSFQRNVAIADDYGGYEDDDYAAARKHAARPGESGGLPEGVNAQAVAGSQLWQRQMVAGVLQPPSLSPSPFKTRRLMRTAARRDYNLLKSMELEMSYVLAVIGQDMDLWREEDYSYRVARIPRGGDRFYIRKHTPPTTPELFMKEKGGVEAMFNRLPPPPPNGEAIRMLQALPNFWASFESHHETTFDYLSVEKKLKPSKPAPKAPDG
eukprot:GHVN01076898.1.p1 GENE.GHVN01076898.1~~GHVN01076898.1.p1  ORF type:complete len:226 (+),score=45.07 GHVN01076898.1:150-827(+)